MAVLDSETRVFVDPSRCVTTSGRYIIRYDTCYHLYRDCRCLDNVDDVNEMSRSSALSDGRLMCGMCQSRYASEVLDDGWSDISDLCGVTGDDVCFELKGAYNQTLLVSAVRWCLGLGGTLESLCRDVIMRCTKEMSPNTASLIAREIREWWCDFVWDDGVMSDVDGVPHEDVYDWVGLLYELDKQANRSRYAGSYDVKPPFVTGKDGRVRSWSDFPEFIRPSLSGCQEILDDETCVVRLSGVVDQLVLVAAVLYCFGRSSYMPGLTADVLSRGMETIEPCVARRIARLIREWWCSRYGFDWPKVMDEIAFDTVSCWVTSLAKLDERAGDIELPRVRGVDSWDDVEDVVWPRNVA